MPIAAYAPATRSEIGGAARIGGPLDLPVFQKAGIIGVGGIFLAIVLSCFIRETGTAVLLRKTGDGPKLQVVPVLGAAQ